MIKKAFTVILCSAVACFLAACSSEQAVTSKDSAVASKGESIIAKSEVASIKAGQSTSKAELDVTELYYNPSKEYESLWQSDLFTKDRFTMNVKLSVPERKEAKRLARSFESHMERGKVFMHYLLTELKARNLPAELAAVPLVESGFHQRARSHANAHGPWQFTRQTGKSFGLTVTAKYDEFYDFVASTQASLNYLEHLYRELDNDWELALIAYNQGEFAVKKAVCNAKNRGVKNISASSITLSKGARTYLKRCRAYAAILQSPESFGVSHPAVDNRVAFVSFELTNSVTSMSQAAKLSGVALDDLKHLNAGFLTDSLKTDKQRSLLIPAENAAQFMKAAGISMVTATSQVAANEQKLDGTNNIALNR